MSMKPGISDATIQLPVASLGTQAFVPYLSVLITHVIPVIGRICENYQDMESAAPLFPIRLLVAVLRT